MPRLLLVYHFFHPDDVAGARQFSELGREQVRRGWEVTALTSNRSWRDPNVRYPARESWEGVDIHRAFRPAWQQARPLSRLGNSAWMIASFVLHARSLGPFDAIVVGSDPAFAALAAPGLRAAFPRAAIVHWCFDVYPEAIEAEDGGPAVRRAAHAARALMGRAYRHLDALVDLGPCMRARLGAYRSGVDQETLPPWALAEPGRVVAPDPATRAALFPRARLGLLYSGTLGRAHEHDVFLALARACRGRSGDAVSLCFSSRGHRYEELRRAVTADDTNIAFAPFADESALPERLAAADLHLCSLRSEWAGIVVPSKFFGSLAVGRPVVFAGPGESEIATWIHRHDVGLHLAGDNLPAAVDRLHALLDDPAALGRWQASALAIYEREFSRRVINDRWDALLRELMTRRRARVA